MALTATFDPTTETIAVNSDRRAVSASIRVAGETVDVSGTFAVNVDDAEHVWVVASDDGTTAVLELA